MTGSVIGLKIVQAVTGTRYASSDASQLASYTGTTIATFLMLFPTRSMQNRNRIANRAKLDKLIRASAAQNCFLGIENPTEEELDDLRARLALHSGAEPDAIVEAADRADAAADAKACEAAAQVAGAPGYPR